MSHPIVIIGASHAGITCAEKLRQYGYAGEIVMMDSVHGMPYQRPPLSKTYLSADAEAEDGFYLRPQSWFDSQNITLMTGTKAASIDTDNSQIHISDGQTIQVETAHGTVSARAWLYAGIRRDTVFIPIGWDSTQPYHPWNSVNYLTDEDQRDPLSDHSNLKSYLCRIQA